MDAATVAETLRQIIEGEDFSAPAQMLRISAKRACLKLDVAPYSIATNVWHCDYWNRIWLSKIEGGDFSPKNIWAEDWHSPDEANWPETRQRFLSNLNRARQLASDKPFKHRMKSDQEAIRRLHQIAAHTAYHVGQIALLKRLVARTTLNP